MDTDDTADEEVAPVETTGDGKVLLNRRMRQHKDQMKTKDTQIKQLQDQAWNLHQRNGELEAEKDLIRKHLKSFLETDGGKEDIIRNLKMILNDA